LTETGSPRHRGGSRDDVRFADTTLRDGQLSLWASSMRTSMMLPVAPLLDRAGFVTAEVLGSSFFKKCVRELRDDPLERVRLLARAMPHTPLRTVVSRSMAAFQLTPPSLERLFNERVWAAGIRRSRISDPSNTVSELAVRVAECREVGLETTVNLIFSVSPKHTDAYYAERAHQVAALRPEAICVKDPGGLLTPERTATLVPAVMAQVGTIPVEFHTHCTTGLGPLCVLEAVRAGVRLVDTCVPPLADGSSNPSVVNVARNLSALGHRPAVDLEPLEGVTAHFTQVARDVGLPLGRPVEFDVETYQHQVPGGMISNLRFQLGRLGLADRLPEVLEECAQVRRDLGHPIMVTPYSQFVGAQAAMNVIMRARSGAERYSQVTDEVILYASGVWGQEEAEGVDPEVRARILDRPRARELAAWRPPQTSIEELRSELGGSQVSDDDLLLRYLAGAEHVEALRSGRPAGPGVPLAGGLGALGTLIRGLTERHEVRSVFITKGDLQLSLGGAVAAGASRAAAAAH
jgi:oxaloacetate decarboxylase alpha subunit